MVLAVGHSSRPDDIGIARYMKNIRTLNYAKSSASACGKLGNRAYHCSCPVDSNSTGSIYRRKSAKSTKRSCYSPPTRKRYFLS